MSKNIKNHIAVGALICNTKRTKYLIQQKDHTYKHQQWIGMHSTWGGAIEKGEKLTTALYRELGEELGSAIEWKTASIRDIGEYQLYPSHPFHYHLFEITLNNAQIDMLLQMPDIEGKKQIIDQSQLVKINWVWGLDVAIQDYFCNL